MRTHRTPVTLTDICELGTIALWPDAGDLLNLSRTSVYKAARDGTIPTLRIGGRVVVPVPALLRMLDADTPRAG